MKNNYLLITFIGLYGICCACSKGDTLSSVTGSSSFTFMAGDSLVNFTVNLALIQDVDNTHTTVITGQYPDSLTRKGSISIRFIGDTTGRYGRDSLLVTYVSNTGTTYYNTNDSANYVQIDKFEKKYNGAVSGKFSLNVVNGQDSIRFSNGSFTALYQE